MKNAKEEVINLNMKTLLEDLNIRNSILLFAHVAKGLGVRESVRQGIHVSGYVCINGNVSNVKRVCLPMRTHTNLCEM